MISPTKIKEKDITEGDRCGSVINIQGRKCLDLRGNIYGFCMCVFLCTHIHMYHIQYKMTATKPMDLVDE